jgi:Carboxypeptidase regulatory-like domain
MGKCAESRVAEWTWSAMVVTVCAALLFASPLRAQVVRGTVVDASERPISGVVVALLDSVNAVVARALTDDAGEYRVLAPRPGTYRLRTLRVGYQPTVSAPQVLTAGGLAVVRLSVDGVRVSLATVRVVERSACGRSAASDAADVFAAWDQAMTTIAATSLTSSARGLTATTMQVDRTLEPNGRRIREQSVAVRTEYVTQPWKSLPADTLRKRGYATTDAEGWTTYYAPGLDVLVSSVFLEDHCLRLVAARDTSEIGVAFEPTPARRQRPEIRGVLWLARSSAELRRLEFSYTGGPVATSAFDAGGSMTFARVPNGASVITAWEIRMPELIKDTPRAARLRVASVASTGGQLVVLRRGVDTLFKQPTLAVTGVVLDSLSARAIPGASIAMMGATTATTADADGRFVLKDVLPGEYALSVRTPSLDSIRASSVSTVVVASGMAPLQLRVPTAAQLAASLCGSALAGAAGKGHGGIIGRVVDLGDTTTLAAVRVIAEWSEIITQGTSIVRQGKGMETKTDTTGAFRLCGVPTDVALTVRALPTRGRSESAIVRLTPDALFASTTVAVDRARDAVATLTGVVVADSSQRVLADVEVAIPSLSLSARSNSRGEFRLSEIPAGTHEVVARRVGYSALSAPVTFGANEEEQRRLVLRPLTVLDSVEVTATRTDPRMLDFEDNRRLGLGHFMTREDLDKNIGRKMGDVLSIVPGLGVVRGGARAYVLSKRYIIPLRAIGKPLDASSVLWSPNPIEKQQGIVTGCYAQVWIEGQLMNPGQPTEPYDVNSIAPDQIEALEYYAGPSQTPSRYAKLNSNCGVLVIHLRRDPP